MTTLIAFASVLIGTLTPSAARAQGQQDPLDRALSTLPVREIGPANMGGRALDIAGDARHPSTLYVGFATGGLWKTENNGVTWTSLFDDQPTSSVGAVALAPSNPNVVWVGTGEADNRQSSTWGMGVFRSLDGGRTWEHMGLEETRQIGRIVVDPRDPDVVWVAANGHLWGANPERGVYKTTDGGATWEKVLYVDDDTGAIDLVMDPRTPDVVFAAMYQHRRTPWGYSADGDGGGLYRTLDGGRNWVELTATDGAGGTAGDGEGAVVFNGRGLPTGDLARIGLDINDLDGDLLYATIESREEGRGVYRSTDRGESWEKMSSRNPRPMYFSLIRIDPMNPDKIWLGGVALSVSLDGGRTWMDGADPDGVHSDHHAMWIDPTNSDHVIIGNDGGVASTWDGGQNWQHHHNFALGQFYQIDVDMRDPYYVCGGLQDNNSWCGPSRSLDESGVRNRHWDRVWGGDGFWNVIDPTDSTYVYSESQNGRLGRYNRLTGESAQLQPVARPTEEGPDREYRFHWNTPIVVSSHDPATVYVGSNHLMRSRDRGMSWEEASPDLTWDVDRDTLPIMGAAVDSTTLSLNDGTSYYSTIVEVSESPLDGDVIYTGSDDGRLQATRDGGATWTDLSGNVPGFGQGDHVSAVEASHASAGRVYMAYDGHRHDDYDTHLFVSDDYGGSWTPIQEGLPASGINVVREHPDTPDLLFVGNEIGLWVSVDRGESWHRLSGGFPTVPVDDVKIHPRDNDLVIGTHGRSIWILPDVTPLQQIANGDVLAQDAHLFPVPRATEWALRNGAWFPADNTFIAPNPPEGARIRYWLREDRPGGAPRPVTTSEEPRGADYGGLDGEEAAERELVLPPTTSSAQPEVLAPAPQKTTLEVLDGRGDVIRTLEGSGEAGIQEVFWDLRAEPPFEAGDEGGGFRRGPTGLRVAPGTYTVRLLVDGTPMEAPVEVRRDPRIQVPATLVAARQDALRQLAALAGPLHEAGEALDRAEDRIDGAERALGDGAGTASLREEADRLGERIRSLRETLGEAAAGGRMQGAIEGITDSPTADQLWHIDQAWEEAPTAIRDVNTFLTGDLAAFESQVYTSAARPDPIATVKVPSRPEE